MCLPAHCAQSGDNLYCVQWLNIVRGRPVKTKIYKIGRGASGREMRVHGTNPMRYPIVRKWCTIGHIEKRIHKIIYIWCSVIARCSQFRAFHFLTCASIAAPAVGKLGRVISYLRWTYPVCQLFF